VSTQFRRNLYVYNVAKQLLYPFVDLMILLEARIVILFKTSFLLIIIIGRFNYKNNTRKERSIVAEVFS